MTLGKNPDEDKSKNKYEDSIYDDVKELADEMLRVGNTFYNMTKKIVNMTSDSVSDLNDKTKTIATNWSDDSSWEKENYPVELTEFRSNIKSFVDDIKSKHENWHKNNPGWNWDKSDWDSWGWSHHNRFWPKENFNSVNVFYDFRHNAEGQALMAKHSDFFRGSFSSGLTPFGLYSQGAPSIRNYNDCMKKLGESVWDSSGYWRCLFPNREVPIDLLNYKSKYMSDRILTKEDLEQASRHAKSNQDGVIDLGEKGTFFKNFEVYMNWKNIMFENIKKERHEKKKKRHEARKAWKEQRALWRKENEDSTSQPIVVSTSIQSTYKTNSETNEVEMNEIRTEVFNDGTSSTKNITRTKPFGASEWLNVIENIDNGHDTKLNSDDQVGWFWK